MPASRTGRRISIVTTGLARGGAETQVMLLAKGLASRAWNVEVVSMLPPEALDDELNNAGITVHRLGMKRGVPDPRAAFRLAKHFRTFRPHIAHCHMVHANLLGRSARVFGSVPVLISTAHSIYEGPKWRDFAYSLTDSLCDLTTNVSSAGLVRYTSAGLSRSDKSAWVPNGIDTSTFTSNPKKRSLTRTALGWNSSFVWIAVGNLREAKDYPNLLRAFSVALKSQPAARLVIVGFGGLRQPLEELARRLEVERAVVFLGARTDVPDLLNAADAYVISSAWEGTPMALLEACASGLPVIATRVGGNPEVVQTGKTGCIVKPQESHELGQAMIAMMERSEAERHALGEAARARVESIYGLPRVLSIWENIYEQLLHQKLFDISAGHRKVCFPWGKGSIWKRS